MTVGRDAEARAMGAALEDARRGRGSVVALSGAPGVGKSRLLSDLVGVARGSGCAVAVGRSVVGGSAQPYRPLSQALMQAVRGADSAFMESLGQWRAGLRVVLPHPALLASVDRQAVADADPLICAEAVLRLLRALAETAPMLLGLEDLHWADRDSLAVVEYLADNVDDSAVACVVTVRSEPPSAATDLVRTLSARRAIRLLEIPPLSDVATETMVLACLPSASADTVRSVVAASEGVPFVVEELLVTGGLPRSFAASVEARLAEMGAVERSVIVAAAVLGRQFDGRLLPAACGQDEMVVSAALSAARDRTLIDVTEGQFRFRHALTRESVLDGLLPLDRQRVARACLAALDGIGPMVGDERQQLEAGLAEQAGLPSRAAAVLLELGLRALRQGALATAVDTLRRAWSCAEDEASRHAARAGLVEALARAGRTDECLSAGGELLGALPEADVGGRVRVHLTLAQAGVEATRWSTVESHLAAAGVLLGRAPDPALDTWRLVLAAEVALGRRDLDAARRLVEQSLASGSAGAEIRCRALELLGRSWRTVDLDRARMAFEQALATADTAGLALARLRALHELGTIDLFDHAGTHRLEQSRDLARDVGAVSTLAVLGVQLAAAHLFRFEPERVAASAEQALALAEGLHLRQLRATACVFLAEGEALRCDHEAMERHNVAALAAAPDDPEIAGSVWGGRAVAALLADDRALARRALDRAHSLLAGLPNAGPGIYLGLRPLLLAADGDPGAAAATRAAARTGITVNRANRGMLRWAEAVLAGRAGSAQADELAERAAADLAAFPVWSDVGRMLAAEAAQLDGWGEPRDWLSSCAATFQARGLDALSRRCRAAADPQRVAPALDLTPREREVLELVTGGLSNRDIAARLTVSPRTVEKHVESLLRKTGSRSRTHLVAMTARHNPSANT